MSLILSIDTATDLAAVALFGGSALLGSVASSNQKEHASFLQPAIRALMLQAGVTGEELDAVAVTIGPGSYTGLRVGLASAKGLCYALGKPLITVGTLEVMALAAIQEFKKTHKSKNNTTIFCPAIDARRNEIFCALYTMDLDLIFPPSAIVLDQDSFVSGLEKYDIACSGSGSVKLKNMLTNQNVLILEPAGQILQLGELANKYYKAGQFSDLAYTEPFYLKAFYSSPIGKI